MTTATRPPQDRDARADASAWPDTGRHRIDAQLGRGGMGAVYRATELGSGRITALKTLERTDGPITALFEREYHTLASIQHPSVIEVYEFGHTRNGQRYYTMELLDGQDLRSLVPLPWRELCRHVRAVAASLSLVHARRLVHRDVSPANVRIGAAGRAKLIDFGALSSFGLASEIVGTPLCMAPEVRAQLPLDGRTDIFSLGVVMYLGLTGVRPFSGRPYASGSDASLRSPAELVPDLPEALDKLVLSMLRFDARARPASCAEVIERIDACIGETAELEHAIAEGHLRSAAFCGRGREMEQLHRHLERTVRGLGGVVLLEGAQGMGRSRLADELLIHAQLAGLACVRVDAAAHPGPSAVMAAITRKILDMAPAEANETLSPHRDALSALLTGTGSHNVDRYSSPRLSAISDPSERRSRLQNAFVYWLLAVSDRVPLLVVAENLESCDEASAGALAALAHEARRHRVLLCGTRALAAGAPVAVSQLGRLGARIKLRGLSRSATAELVSGVFGDASGCERLSEWVYAVGQGNPARAMDLLAHLVARGTIRYVGGTWTLPARLDDEDLPTSLEEALQARIDSLEPVAHGLAQLFALHQGALSLALCQELMPDAEPGAVYRAIDELVAADMLTVSGQTYRLRHQGLREPLLAPLGPAARKPLHLTLAGALITDLEDMLGADSVAAWQAAETPALNRALQAGWHYLRGGDDRRAQILLRNAGIELTRRGDGLAEAVPALEAALETYATQGRSHFEQAYLLVPLTLAGTYGDFRVCYRYADRVLQTLLEVSGLSLANRLRPWLGNRFSLWLSLGLGAIRFYLTSRRNVSRNYMEALLGVIGIGSAIIGTSVPLLDRQRSKRTLELLRPLSGFPPGHPARITYEFQIALNDATWGRYYAAAERGHQALTALRKPGGVKGLPEEARVQLEVGVLILLASLDATRVDGRVHTTTEILQTLRTAESRQTRAGSLASYHANRGERTQFLKYQREVDVLAAQLGSTWRQDVLIPRNLWWTYTLCEDVMGLKQVMRQLETLAHDAPSLSDHRDAAVACYLAQRGRSSEALERFGLMFERTAREPVAMAMRHAGAYARILRLAGRAEEALALCESVLSAMSPGQLEFGTVAFGVELERCLATQAVGHSDRAAEMLDTLLAGMVEHDNPLLHGLAHRARAEVALDQSDESAFEEHLSAADKWLSRTDNPALLAMVREVARKGQQRGIGGAGRLTSSFPPSVASLALPARMALAACDGADERVQVALDLVVSASRAERGYFYVLEPDGLRFAAPAVGEEPPESLASELAAWLDAAIALDVSPDEVTRTVAPFAMLDPDAIPELGGPACATHDGERFRPLLLETVDTERAMRVGVVALVPGDEPLVGVPFHYLQEIAQALYSAGDVRTVYLGGELGSADMQNGRRQRGHGDGGNG